MEDLVKGCASAIELVYTAMQEDEARFEEFESSIDAFVKSIVDPAPVDRTPFRNKKKLKRQSNVNEINSSTRSSVASTASDTLPLAELMPAPTGRVPRQAAEKAKKGLKEPSCSSKLRNDESIKIKKERISGESSNSISRTKTSKIAPIVEDIAKETARLSINEIEPTSNDKAMDESIIMVPNKMDEIVTLSDGESTDSPLTVVVPVPPKPKEAPSIEMPPPPAKAPTRTKTRQKKVKEEPISTNTIATSSVETTQTRSTRSKKPKNIPIPQTIVKIEAVSTPTVTAPPEQMDIDNVATDKVVAANVTAESVYEDARDGVAKHASPIVPPMPMDSTFVQPGNATYVQPGSNTTYVQPINSTFVQPAANDTYVASGNVTNVVQPNETFHVDAASAKPTVVQNETMVIEAVTGEKRPNPSMSSIMTDDISDEELTPRPAIKPKPTHIAPIRSTNKNQKELFNPCIQSPMKKKVEAFESYAQSPAEQMRVTRNKACGDGGSRSLLKQPSTPKVADIIKNLKSYTPQDVKRIPGASSASVGGNPTSKLAHLNRPGSASKVASMPRESVEDIKKTLLEQAEEKKRKREEKLKQVQLLREAKEKEKADKLKKQMQEKEEKIRQETEKKRLLKERKDRDAESKRNLEEIQRNIKIQALKNAEKAKMERELAEAARKEREQIDQQRILVEKNVLQQKLKQNQLNKQKASSNKFTFQMLNTDDETDDDESHNNQNRPQPPQWSLRGYREDRINSQSHLKQITIDHFFSSQPTTPDLKEIFPQIHEKHLKRNSSAVWNTPPRYSTMNVPRY